MIKEVEHVRQQRQPQIIGRSSAIQDLLHVAPQPVQRQIVSVLLFACPLTTVDKIK